MEVGDRVRVRVDGMRGHILRIDEVRGQKRYLVEYDDTPRSGRPLTKGADAAVSGIIVLEHELEPI